MKYPLAKLARRSIVQQPPYYFDGIHLDFSKGDNAVGHYVKAAGSAPTLAAFSTLFAFTSGNQSMYMGPAGVLVASATNTPRFEYTSTGDFKGLLMEVSRTNLGLWSNDGTNAAWTKTNCTAAKTATGPDGAVNTATTLTATSGNATCLQSVVSASAQRTYSIWLKRRTGSGNIDMTVDGGTGWTTKTITSSWARYSITQSGVTNPNFGVRIVTSGDAVDFYCSQLESAAGMSSSIPTTTASVARTVDRAVRTLGSEYSQSTGAIAARLTTQIGNTGGNQFVARFSDNTYNSAIALNLGSGGIVGIATAASGTFDGSANAAGAIADGQNFRAATAYAANDLGVSKDGSAIVTDPSATMPSGLTRLDLAHDHAAAASNSCQGIWLRTLDYWPTRLPNGFLTSY